MRKVLQRIIAGPSRPTAASMAAPETAPQSGPKAQQPAYSEAFYAAMSGGPDVNSTSVLKAAFEQFAPKSLLDCGCGTGKWVATALQFGVVDAVGVDYVDRSKLCIPEANFIERDLEHATLDLGRTFDMAICLEVVEHLTPERAPSFIREICTLSDVVLFSAALPFQGGTWHINEQWLEYWGILFRQNGYVPLDLLRDGLWANTEIAWYYRQNVVFFCRADKVGSIFPGRATAERTLLTRLHPEMFLAQVSKLWPYMYGEAYYQEVNHHRMLATAWLGGDTALPPAGHRKNAAVDELGAISLADLQSSRGDESKNNRIALVLPLSVEGDVSAQAKLRGGG